MLFCSLLLSVYSRWQDHILLLIGSIALMWCAMWYINLKYDFLTLFNSLPSFYLPLLFIPCHCLWNLHPKCNLCHFLVVEKKRFVPVGVLPFVFLPFTISSPFNFSSFWCFKFTITIDHKISLISNCSTLLFTTLIWYIYYTYSVA